MTPIYPEKKYVIYVRNRGNIKIKSIQIMLIPNAHLWRQDLKLLSIVTLKKNTMFVTLW